MGASVSKRDGAGSYPDAVAATVTIERVIDLPRVIVGDALVDPVLVEGWLDPHLRLDSPEFAGVSVDAEEVPGGTRGTSTRVTVTVEIADPRFGPGVSDGWEERLDRLENLLRGHPTSWHDTSAAKRAAN